MSQPIKKNIINPPKPHKKQTTKAARVKKARERAKAKHEYGTSKLEEKFAKEFLDKLGVEYVYQYKADSIKRFFDFRICIDGTPKGPIIEVNGGYWHADPRLYEEKDLNRTQIRDKKIDEIKKAWCSRNGIPLIYVWEMDINKNPKKVLTMLKELLHLYEDKKRLDDEKKKRH